MNVYFFSSMSMFFCFSYFNSIHYCVVGFVMQRWVIEVNGAPGTLYSNETYQLQVDFPEHYPMEAPQVRPNPSVCVICICLNIYLQIILCWVDFDFHKTGDLTCFGLNPCGGMNRLYLSLLLHCILIFIATVISV